MDFHSLKRKELQSLCKKHGIPANKTNRQMADLLTATLKVKGNSILKEDKNEIISEDGQKKFKKVRFSPDIETRENEPSEYKKPARRTTRATKLSSSSLEESEKSVLPNEVGNKRGRGNGKIGSFSRITRSQAKLGKEISSVTETETELVNAGVVNRITRCKSQSAVSISAAEGKSEVCGTTIKESSKGIARTASKRKSIVQLDVPVESKQPVPKESRKRRKIMDLDVVTEVKAALETSKEIEKAQPPAACLHRSRRKTIMLNSNIVPEESVLDEAVGKLKLLNEKTTGKEKYAAKGLRRSNRRASIYAALSNISPPVADTELTVAEAAGGNIYSSMQRYNGLKNSKKRGKSKSKPRGERNIDCVDVSALNSHIGVEIDSATNLAETISSTLASDSKEEETLNVAGEYEVVNEKVIVNTGNLISDGSIKGVEDNQCPLSAKCVNLVNIKETLKAAKESDNANEHIVLDTSSFSIEDGAHDQCRSSEKCANLVNKEEMFNVAEGFEVVNENIVLDTGNLMSNGSIEGDADYQRRSHEKFANSDSAEVTMKVARGSAVRNENIAPDTGNLISGGNIECGSHDQCQSSKKCANSETVEEISKVAVESAVINEDNVRDISDSILNGGVLGVADHPSRSSEKCANLDNCNPAELNFKEFQAEELDVVTSSDGVSIVNQSAFGGQNSNYSGLKKMLAEEVTSTGRDAYCRSDDISDHSAEFDGINIQKDGVNVLERLDNIEDEIENKLVLENGGPLQSVNVEIISESIKDLFQETNDVNDRSTEVGRSIEEDGVVNGLEWNEKDGTVDEEEHGQEAHQWKASLAVGSETIMESTEDKCDGANEHSNEIQRNYVAKDEVGGLEKIGHDELTDEVQHVRDKDARSTAGKSNVQEIAVAILHEAISSCSKLVVSKPAGISSNADSSWSKPEIELHHSFSQQKGKASCEEYDGEIESDEVIISDNGSVEISDYESKAFELNLLFQEGECVVEKPGVEEMKKMEVLDQPHALTASVVNQDGDGNNCELKLLSPKETCSCSENDKNDVHCQTLSFSVMKTTSASGLIQMTPQKIVDPYGMKGHEPANQRKESLAVGAENIIADTEDVCSGANEQLNVIHRNHMTKDSLQRIEHVESTDEVQLEVEPPNWKDNFQADSKTLLQFEKDDVQDAEDKESVALGRYACQASEVTGSYSKPELEDGKGIFQFVQEEKDVNGDQHDFVTGLALTCRETTRFRFNGDGNDVLEGAQGDALPHFFMDELEDGKVSYNAVPKNSSDEICEKDLGDSMICDSNVGEPFLSEALDAPSSLELPSYELNKCEDTNLKIQVESTFFTDMEINLIHGNGEHDQFVHEDLSDGNLICKDLEQAMHLEQAHLEKCELALENFRSEGSGCAELTEDKAAIMERVGQDRQFGKPTKVPGDMSTINQEFVDLQDDEDNKAANSFFSARARVSVESYNLNTGHNDSLDQSTTMHGPHILKEQTNISHYEDQGISENEVYGTNKDSRAATGKINGLEEAENGGSVPSVFSDEASHQMAGTILHKTMSSSCVWVVNRQAEISSSADSDCGKPEMELHHSFTLPHGEVSYELDGHMEDEEIIIGDNGRVKKCGEDASNPIYNPSEGNDVRDHGEVANEQLDAHLDALRAGVFIDNTGFPNELSYENRTMIEYMEDGREPCLHELDEFVTIASSKQMSATMNLDASSPIKGKTTDSVGDSPCYESEALELNVLFQEGESVVENRGVDGSPTNLMSMDAGKLPAKAITELSSTRVAEEPSNLKQGRTGITEAECVIAKPGVEPSPTNLMNAGNFPENAITNLSSTRANEDPNNRRQGHACNFIVQEQQEEIPQFEEMPEIGAMMVDQSHTVTTSLDNEDVTGEEGKICELKVVSPMDTSSHPETEQHNSFKKEALSSVMKKTSRTSLIRSTPQKVVDMYAMKENAPNVKMELLTSLTASRMSQKRRPLEDLKKQ